MAKTKKEQLIERLERLRGLSPKDVTTPMTKGEHDRIHAILEILNKDDETYDYNTLLRFFRVTQPGIDAAKQKATRDPNAKCPVWEGAILGLEYLAGG